MRVYFFLFTTLAGIWVVLSGYFSGFFIVCGLIAIGITLGITTKMMLAERGYRPLYFRPPFLPYIGWLFFQILLSSLAVVRTVWQVKMDIAPTLTWITSQQTTDIGKTTYANSITLTPGTVCTLVEKDALQIHALDKHSVIWLRKQIMDKKIQRLTEYA